MSGAIINALANIAANMIDNTPNEVIFLSDRSNSLFSTNSPFFNISWNLTESKHRISFFGGLDPDFLLLFMSLDKFLKGILQDTGVG